MKLIDACKDVLEQLGTVLKEIREDDFTKPVTVLNNATIGQHIRHTLEFFICLMENHTLGVVNYDKRNHDKLIESDKHVALKVINDLKCFLENHSDNFPLKLAFNYDVGNDDVQIIETNYFRELSYNIEHAIHHMAIIKIGLNTEVPYVEVPSHFGVAVSTIKFHKAQIFFPNQA